MNKTRIINSSVWQGENVCGVFLNTAYEESVREAAVRTKTCFGKATELYHVAGNVSIVGNKASFKGCKYVLPCLPH